MKDKLVLVKVKNDSTCNGCYYYDNDLNCPQKEFGGIPTLECAIEVILKGRDIGEDYIWQEKEITEEEVN